VRAASSCVGSELSYLGGRTGMGEVALQFGHRNIFGGRDWTGNASFVDSSAEKTFRNFRSRRAVRSITQIRSSNNS
jgi:hypothetical protein